MQSCRSWGAFWAANHPPSLQEPFYQTSWVGASSRIWGLTRRELLFLPLKFVVFFQLFFPKNYIKSELWIPNHARKRQIGKSLNNTSWWILVWVGEGMFTCLSAKQESSPGLVVFLAMARVVALMRCLQVIQVLQRGCKGIVKGAYKRVTHNSKPKKHRLSHKVCLSHYGNSDQEATSMQRDTFFSFFLVAHFSPCAPIAQGAQLLSCQDA